MTDLHIHTFESTKRFITQFDDNWIIVVIMIALLLLSLLITRSSDRLKHIPEALVNDIGINKLLFNGSLFNNGLGYFMLVFYAIPTSLFYYELLTIQNSYTYGLHGFYLYIVLFGIALLIPAIKWVIISFMLYLINFKEVRQQIITINLSYNYAVGVFLLFATIICTYSPYKNLTYITLALMVILYIFSFLRIFFIGFNHKQLSNIYYFIYLCMLKILPAVAIAVAIFGQ